MATRWDEAKTTPIEDVRWAMEMIVQRSLHQPPTTYLVPQNWTMTEIGPLPPQWECVDRKPRRRLLAYLFAWIRARR